MTDTLAPPPARTHVAYMDEAREVFRRILTETPGSIRELAREAGLSEGLLRAVRDGRRSLTPETARAVADALQGWAATCSELAEALDATTEREDPHG